MADDSDNSELQLAGDVLQFPAQENILQPGQVIPGEKYLGIVGPPKVMPEQYHMDIDRLHGLTDEPANEASRYNYNDLLQLAHNAGFQGQSADTIAKIALAESGGNSNNVNPNDPQGSYGLLQINQAAWPGTQQEALNPQGAFNLAYNISRGGTDFNPWSTYKHGQYENVLKGTGFSTGLGGNNLLSAQAQPFQASEYPSFQPISSEGSAPSDHPNLAINLPMEPQTQQPGVNPIFLLSIIRSMMSGSHSFTPVYYDPWAVVEKKETG